MYMYLYTHNIIYVYVEYIVLIKSDSNTYYKTCHITPPHPWARDESELYMIYISKHISDYNNKNYYNYSYVIAAYNYRIMGSIIVWIYIFKSL